MRYIAAFLAFASFCLAQTAADPHTLIFRAKGLLPQGRTEAAPILRQAVELLEKRSPDSDEYAEALLLLGMSLYPSLAGNKEALAAKVEPLARRAVEIRQTKQAGKSSDLALALEFSALVLEGMGRLEDSRAPKAKARELRDNLILAMQPPAEEQIADPAHMGPGIRPPTLVARAEPTLTFEARVLQLNPEVLVEVIIGRDGQMHHIEVYKPAGFGLDEKAVEALMKWRLTPAQKDGAVVPVDWMIKLKFQ